MAARVLAAKEELLEQSPWGSTTALTSHMWVTRSILADALGYDTKADTSKVSQGGGLDLVHPKTLFFSTRPTTTGHRPPPTSRRPPPQFESLDIPTASISVVEYPREGAPTVVYMGVKPEMLEASETDKAGIS